MITINSDYANYIDNGSIGMENIRTEDIFVVDTSSRAIIVPESWTAVGALQDHFAEKIWFSVWNVRKNYKNRNGIWTD